jgi:uncharacterized protein (DUF433 family)
MTVGHGKSRFTRARRKQSINRGRGPEIEGTRITVYDVLDYVSQGWHRDRIAALFRLSSRDIQAALDYIDQHHDDVMASYQRICARQQEYPYTPDVAAKMTKLIIENLGFPSVLAGKPVALLGVAAGRIGAIKSLEQLKGVCSHIGAIVVPGSVSVAGVHKVFDAQGRCTDAETATLLRGLGHALLSFLKEYVCPRHVLEEMVQSDAPPWSTNV